MDRVVREINAPSREDFEADILHGGEPVVMRGLVTNRPGIGRSTEALFQTLKSCDSGAMQGTLLGQSGTGDKFHYSSDLGGQNYGQIGETLSAALDGLLAGPHPDGAYIQSIPLDKHMPDFEKYAGFEQALKTKMTVTLKTADAISIPYGRWHHIRAIPPLNMLVNYWFLSSEPRLDENARGVWSNLFNHYVFRKHGDPMRHVTELTRGLLGGIFEGQERGALVGLHLPRQ